MTKGEPLFETLLTISIVIGLLNLAFIIYAHAGDIKNRKKQEDKGGWGELPKYKVYNPEKDPLRQLEGEVENQFKD